MHLLKRKAAPLIYHVGIDIGASRVHAATARMTPLGEERVEPFPLGNSRVDMPALMSVAPDGDLEFGDAAAARGADQPETLVSSIRARVGSAVPFVVGDHRISADDAYARLAATVVAAVAASEGGPAGHVVVTYPAAWGAHRLAGVRRALAAHCQGPVQLMPEPEAAAWGSAQPAQRGQLWALYDLGETSLDTAVLRREEGGWTILSTATRPVPVGGIDIDDAVLGHLLSAAPTSTVLPRASLATLRLTSADVKEALSTDTEVALPTRLEPASPTVRLTRGEFETMIQGLLNQTVLALRETIDDGGVTVEDLSAVLLAGGSARIPLVAQHVSAVLDVPVGASSDPGTMIAMGAARSGVAQEGSRPSTPGASTDEQSAPEGDTALSQDELSPDGPSVLLPFVHPDQRRLATHAWRLVVAALVVASAAYLVWGFTSDSSGLFGLAPHGGPALELLGGR